MATAQAWVGDTCGVLWECFSVGSHGNEQCQAELVTFWRTVEDDMGVAKVYTLPSDPAYAEGYTEFLSEL